MYTKQTSHGHRSGRLFIAGPETSAGANTVAANATEKFLYHSSGLDGRGGSSYIDKVVFRDRDTDADGGRDERRYYLQNWRNDVVALITTTGAWVERYRYDAYGRPESYSVADIAGSGGGGGGPNGLVTSTDSGAYSATGAVSWKNDLGSSGGSLVPDNVVNATDDLAAFNAYYAAGNNGGLGQISDTGIDNRKGLAGYEFDPILAGDGAIDGLGVPLYHVRNRVLNSYSGKWMQKDPLGHHDSMDLYEYCQSDPVDLEDWSGLAAMTQSCNSGCSSRTSALIDAAGGVFAVAGVKQPSPATIIWIGCPQYTINGVDKTIAKEATLACRHCGTIIIQCVDCRTTPLGDRNDPRTWRQGETMCGFRRDGRGRGGCPSIKICIENQDGEDAWRIASHELVHAAQCCRDRSPLFASSCEEQIIREWEAYQRTGQCSDNSSCCTRACGSATATCRGQGFTAAECRELCRAHFPWTGP